ncbi:MAG: protein phosphatase 2C domain-containing protein [Lachnospiraceae bacterium]|jgi:serine/threonine protein phosphatase PrpC|nr:protein phosphatase 2C domain-containing protein [Lachnospiraceae bacterium]
MDYSNLFGAKNIENGFAKAACHSIIGHREYQQDCAGLAVKGDCLLAVLSDGMGGLSAGEVASRHAVETLLRDFEQWGGQERPGAFLVRETRMLDQQIHLMEDGEGKPLHAGATFIALILEGNLLHFVSVGDSRIYFFHGGRMYQLTRDHNYMTELLESLKKGEITQDYYEQESKGKRAEALTSYLGMGGLKRLDVNASPIPFQEDDLMLVCCDGIYRSLSEEQIVALLLDNAIDTEVTATRLVNEALRMSTGHQDNTTAIVLHPVKPDPEKTVEI